MINLTLHEELLAESRASSHCRTTPQLLQAKAPCTQQPAFLAMASVAASMPPPPFSITCHTWLRHALSLSHYRGRFGNVVLADAGLTSSPYRLQGVSAILRGRPVSCLLWSWELQSSQQYQDCSLPWEMIGRCPSQKLGYYNVPPHVPAALHLLSK